MIVHKALTIAGSDSGGGAGIQADIKTFQELEVYGMTTITAITAQNTTGVQGVYPVQGEGIEAQLKAIGLDLQPDALKTGMLFSAEIIGIVAEQIKRFQWKNLVVDPVMIAKGGASLLQEEAITALKKDLLPLAKVLTPNLPEAEVLTGRTIRTLEEKQDAAKRLHALGADYVVIKGGHDENAHEVVDLLYDGEDFEPFVSPRIQTQNTHGTGCTFSAAITAELAKGQPVKEAVRVAKHFIQSAIKHDLLLGAGHGPTNHWAYNKYERRVK